MKNYWINIIEEALEKEYRYNIVNSDLLDNNILSNFGDAIRIHHSISYEPFSKDKFEYVLVKSLEQGGYQVSMTERCNAGYDIIVGGTKISLKTQADKRIQNDILYVSKLMELGKGKWGDDPEDLKGLLDQFLTSLAGYDRVFTLRCLRRGPEWSYELVEIPKDLLMLSKSGILEMKLKSKQYPKPGYCYVYDDDGSKCFELYFDGGTERKLSIKNLKKDLCTVHATLEFSM